MNNWKNLYPHLTRAGTYSSPPGGSRKPVSAGRREVLIEIISEGSVFGFESPRMLHGEGSVFFHQEGQPSVSDSPADSYYGCYVVRYQCGPGGFPHDWPRVFKWKERRAMHAFMGEMLGVFHQASASSHVVGNLILARLDFERERSRSLSCSREARPQLILATDFLNRNFAQPLSLGDVAGAAGVSISHLHMLFREQLGISPHRFLIERRLRFAGHALATGTSPIKEVAVEAGYSNVEGFCRAFRKFFGCSASEYRQVYSS